MQFIGKITDNKFIYTDDYDEEEIRKEIPFKHLVRDLLKFEEKRPCMVFDTKGRFYKTITWQSYTPLELYGV